MPVIFVPGGMERRLVEGRRHDDGDAPARGERDRALDGAERRLAAGGRDPPVRHHARDGDVDGGDGAIGVRAQARREDEVGADERAGALHRRDVADDDDAGALARAHVAERLGDDLGPDPRGIADGDGERLHRRQSSRKSPRRTSPARQAAHRLP